MKAYAVCTTPRTGSDYLCELLTDAQLGKPDEFLNPKYRKWGDLEFDNAYELAKIAARFDVFGIKLHWSHRHVENPIVLDFDQLHENMRWIYLYRRDTDSQARSWITALERDEWNGTSQPYVDAPEWRVELFKDVILQRSQEWQSWFRRKRIRPLRVEFERLIDDPDNWVRRIKEFVLA